MSSRPRRYFFVHLQKTAGTSLIKRIRRHFPERAVYPHASDGDIVACVISVEHLLARWQARADEIEVVSGHFPLCTTELLGGDFTTLTVLRDPLERTLSYLRHHRLRTPADRHMPLEQVYEDQFRFDGLIHNHMTKMLSLLPEEMDAGALTRVEFTSERLERAKARLEKVDAVGVQEQLDTFCEQLTRAVRLAARSAAEIEPNRGRRGLGGFSRPDPRRQRARRRALRACLPPAWPAPERRRLSNDMFPFWKRVIAPTLEAAGARRIVEIGALRGETTAMLLDDLGPEAELHVIDPVPMFDPSEHERRFSGRYHFHRALSHDVLPSLPAMDAALDRRRPQLVHRLQRAEDAGRGGAHRPIRRCRCLFMHDVGWPYGRRDLYYAPERIPEEFRQPYAQRGIRRGSKELVEKGGINSRMYNAQLEGGPRNGVMTALDDFVAEHDRELSVVVLPFYFGLAIVAEQQQLASRPQLAEALEQINRPPFLRQMLGLSESLRLKEVQLGTVDLLRLAGPVRARCPPLPRAAQARPR